MLGFSWRRPWLEAVWVLAACVGALPAAETELLPASADLRPALERVGLETRFQGKRATCSVFTVADSIEFAAAQRGVSLGRVSVEYLNWAANQVTDEAPDDGAFFSDIWKGFLAHGACPETALPYREAFDPAAEPGAPAREQAKACQALGLELHWIKQWDPNRGLSAEELTEVRRTLAQGWPVCGGFLWPKKEEWKDGVLQVCPREAVRDGHSVLLVGYRDDPAQPGGGELLFRNTSGRRREGRFSYAYLRAYMNDAVWIGSPPKPAAPGSALAGAALADAAEETPRVPSAALDPLAALALPPVGRSRRVSSNEQPWHDANLDMNWLQPGQSVEVPLDGPGVITHMWFTSHAGWANELNALSLRIYWDGRSEPGVEAPLGDFFAVGQGRPAPVESIPVQVSPTGSLTCYWRMPFARSARIVITNDNPDRGAGLYWQIDWMKLDSLPAGTAYFHAQYRQEYPARKGDYLLADLSGAGKYVGTVMSVTLAQEGWFGEGDDFFSIDGEEIPSLQGTGSEDYFNDAWGFRPRTAPWFGQPRWQGDQPGDSGVCYRWHVLDPVHFSQSLRVAIEHKGNYDDAIEGFYLERPEFLSSVAFWYQTGEPKRFGELPPWPERRVPWQQQHLVRVFPQVRNTGTAEVKVETQGFFGARPVLGWDNREIDAHLSLPLSVAEDGRYAVRLNALGGPEMGRYAVRIDDRPLRDADFHAGEEQELDLGLGTLELTRGTHTLTFTAVDLATNPRSAGPLAVEMIRLLKLPAPATREVKTRHEAHFIRLGIGRALYAYRLAYGQLPESLQAMVDAGILPERYLRDENNQPLKARREGDAMVVESPADGGWRHSWQGLDPRR